MAKNAFGQLILSKNMMQKHQILLVNFFQFYPDKTGRNWMTIGETLKDVKNTGKNLLSYLFSHKRLWSLIHWVDCYCLETWCRKHITLTYFFHFYPDKTWKTRWQLTWIMEKIERYQTDRKKQQLIIIPFFLQKIMVTNASLLFQNMIFGIEINYFWLFEVAKFGRNCMSGKKKMYWRYCCVQEGFCHISMQNKVKLWMVSIIFQCLNIFMPTYFTAFLVGHIMLTSVW